MAKLKEYNGRYCEADFENAFLSFLEAEGWQYLAGSSIPRASRREVLYMDDLEQFLSKNQSGFVGRRNPADCGYRPSGRWGKQICRTAQGVWLDGERHSVYTPE